MSGGTYEISSPIAHYEFLSGCAFILGSPVPPLGNDETIFNNMMNNEYENGCLKAVGS
jgi:hypothetical protein